MGEHNSRFSATFRVPRFNLNRFQLNSFWHAKKNKIYAEHIQTTGFVQLFPISSGLQLVHIFAFLPGGLLHRTPHPWDANPWKQTHYDKDLKVSHRSGCKAGPSV